MYQENKLGNLFKYLAISILFMLVGFTVGLLFIPASVVAIANKLLLVFLIFMMLFSLFSRKRGRIPMLVVWLYTFLEGILCYPTFMYYLADLGVGLFFSIIIGVFVIFAILSIIALRQPDNKFIGLGKILFVSLFVLIIVGIVNIFIGSTFINILYSLGGIVVFVGYILFDINGFKSNMHNIEDRDDYSIWVLNIFLDILNLLLDMLNLASSLDD